MSSLLPFIISGVVAGSLYGLAGIGLVLTYRTSGVFNFGHGAIAAGSAFVFYTLHETHGMAWPVAAVITVVLFGVVVGWVVDLLTRAVVGAAEVLLVVLTVGIMLLVQGIVYQQYGVLTRSFPSFLPETGFTVSGVLVSWGDVVSFIVAGGAAIGLYIFLARTRMGIAMRAVVDNPQLVSLSGYSSDRLRLYGWMIGCSTAAVSGILIAPTLNLDVNLLTMLIVQAFGACAIGRFRSLPMTFVGGLVIGVGASIVTKYATTPPFSGIPASVPFLVLVAALLVVPARDLPTPRASRLSLLSRPIEAPLALKGAVMAVVGLGLLLVPDLVGNRLSIWTTSLAYVVVFASLAILTWGSGQISLCHASFLAVGATTMAHLTNAGVPWLLALVGAGLATVPVGALVAIPAIRLSGVYLALITLGFAILMQNVVYSSFLMFGNQLRISVPRPALGPIDGTDDRTLYYIVLAIVVVCCIGLIVLRRSRLGRLLQGLGEVPSMLTTQGLNINLTRLLVFCISAFFAGIGGALSIAQPGSASGVTFTPLLSLFLLAILAICGTTILRSPILAAAAYGLLPGYVTGFDFESQILAFGLLSVVASVLISKRQALNEWFAASARTSAFRRADGPIGWPTRAAGTRRALAEGAPHG